MLEESVVRICTLYKYIVYSIRMCFDIFIVIFLGSYRFWFYFLDRKIELRG